MVNQKKWNNSEYSPTVQGVRLPEPLLPHDSVQLTFDWHYQISLQSGREGMIDSTTYFLHIFIRVLQCMMIIMAGTILTFMDAHEFYSDFNDYTLT